ncbi:hypothetical protein H4R33_000761 [Dimargaris cristalligena]|uniref:FAD/NAD(P)-binding domain-containing protein n=1 Tax=Dimargaris cristalligena TaxID=215637 RepID=A0A4P9ZUM3_9FUNG|nr:hypothetical protein H4R33_000761 [Dimargaris cristalligena]RKP36591.1 hypothetical protein BJ085DRAFT_37461 [Dimargaris cristalligena]|eukprot:RKP36591.1 hypothetical protein BJ085DRAFT_37461 [Dimargaris cristalligena]
MPGVQEFFPGDWHKSITAPTRLPIRLAVVGGSTAGVETAQGIVRSFSPDQVHVTLIDRYDHHYHKVGAVRGIMDRSFADLLWIPFTNVFHGAKPTRDDSYPNHQFLQGEVTQVLDGHLLLQDSPFIVEYDYLVLATGSSSAHPFSPLLPSRALATKVNGQFADDMAYAENILIIGGGPLGVEIAGEIKHASPDKNITIVHRGEQLLSSPLSLKFRRRVTQRVEELGVNVILGDSIDLQDEANSLSLEMSVSANSPYLITTRQGIPIEADKIIQATGTRVYTEFLQSLETDTRLGIIGPDERIRVLPTLQIKDDNYPHIFAVGDVNDIKCVKNACKASHQVRILLRNLKLCIGAELRNPNPGQRPVLPKLRTFEDSESYLVLALGPQKGICLFPRGLIFGDWAARVLKGRDLQVAKKWRQMGIPFPAPTTIPAS